MSNIYVQEPPTEGKVCLETSVGEIDIELWSKECPKACRNFVQLCMEGYYDKTKFFRVVPEFIVQGGDPTNSGEGGESIWGKPFRDEFHSRLRFVRRGLVAMANAGRDDNGSQFFFTLAATKELTNKHTIFGKVGGDTVYNMIRLGQGVIEDGDRPKYPHKILKTKVLVNPFPDIEPRTRIEMERTDDDDRKKSKMKATKNFGLLSFGDEAEEDEMDTEKVIKDKRGKGKSAHDLASDPKLLSQVDHSQLSAGSKDKTEEDINSEEEKEKEKELSSIRNKLKKSKDVSSSKVKKSKEVAIDLDDDELDWESENPFEAERRKKIEKLQAEAKSLSKGLKNKDKKKDKESGEVAKEVKEEDKLTEEEANNDMLRDYHKKQKQAKKESKSKVPNSKSDREAQTLAMLAKFKNKLSGIMYEDEDQDGGREKKEIPSENKPDDSKGEDDDSDIVGDDWMKAPLVFETEGPVLAKDASTKDDDWFDIYDPRNPMNKRRRERDAKDVMEKSRKDKMMKL